MPPALNPAVQRRIAHQLLAPEPDMQAIANSEQVSGRVVRKYRLNLKLYGSVRAPEKPNGRPRALTTEMSEALYIYTLNKPSAMVQEMQDMLDDEFCIELSLTTIQRELKRMDVTYKRLHYRAAERNQSLRLDWSARCLRWTPEQLMFVDESAVNEHTGLRSNGWAPKGSEAAAYTPLNRSKRWSILPVYTISGIVTYSMYHGSYNAERFNGFIKEYLLPFTNPFPGARSVLVLDNASIHKSKVSTYIYGFN
jgi:transposase